MMELMDHRNKFGSLQEHATTTMDLREDEAHVSHHDRVVELINLIGTTRSESIKIGSLTKIQDIVLDKDTSLLDNFLDEVLAFQNDSSADVRAFMVGFIQEACRKDNDILPKVVANLQLLMNDPSVMVQKKVVQCMIQLYPIALAWLARAKMVTDVMQSTWSMMGRIKRHIFDLIDSDNDGMRTMAVRFMEMTVLVQTYTEQNSFTREQEFCLDDVPLTLKVARPRKLEEEARAVFEKLLQFHGSPHISSANLMTCISTLTLAAQMRPQLMAKAVGALEMLHANLPPTLGKSQVSSVRKHLKLKLLGLLRHPSTSEYRNNIATLLTDLGATQQEVSRCFPRTDLLRKRTHARIDAVTTGVKRVRLNEEEDGEEDEEEEEYDDDDASSIVSKPPVKKRRSEAVDVTERHVLEHLTPAVAADLVFISMGKLPDTMPPHFSAVYTPIAAAGTEGQIRHVARLLSTQLTAASLGPGAEQARLDDIKPFNFDYEDDDSTVVSVAVATKSPIATLIGGTLSSDTYGERKHKPVPASLLPTGVAHKKHRMRVLKLAEITRPLEPRDRRSLLLGAIERILQSERSCVLGGASESRGKIIATLAVQMDEEVRQIISEFIFQDVRQRCDLAFAWLYEEYSHMQGFIQGYNLLRATNVDEDTYNKVLCRFVCGFLERSEAKDKDALLFRLYLEAPLVTEDAIDQLKQVCQEEGKAATGISLLKELVIRRPSKQLLFLNVLLEYNAYEEVDLRTRAIDAIKYLYDRGDLCQVVEEYAIMYLKFLLLPHPPKILFGPDKGRPDVVLQWTEDVVRACLYLYLALLPKNEKMIHELAMVYVQTNADVKRTVLRLLEKPVKGMGMDSPELLRLVENCPKGAETLVTRVIHVLTDKTPPSSQLVARVRDLYHKRVSDVRFLIPVLNGLTKKEVIAALPKLIKLNPVVVKEVFNRLLGTHVDVANHTSPLTPAELMVALHNVDPAKCDVKTVIKATSLCFGEIQIYTQEVLAVVMQQLMEQSPLPTLLMRTVIQSLTLYPRLIGFVMNILQRLILKQVWQQKKVWEGFIKCCQRTKPQSFQVLLQLPTTQLREVMTVSPELRDPLLAHVMKYTESQRAHIPQSIMDVLMGVPASPDEEPVVKEEPPSPPDLTIDMREEAEDSTHPVIKMEECQ